MNPTAPFPFTEDDLDQTFGPDRPHLVDFFANAKDNSTQKAVLDHMAEHGYAPEDAYRMAAQSGFRLDPANPFDVGYGPGIRKTPFDPALVTDSATGLPLPEAMRFYAATSTNEEDRQAADARSAYQGALDAFRSEIGRQPETLVPPAPSLSPLQAALGALGAVLDPRFAANAIAGTAAGAESARRLQAERVAENYRNELASHEDRLQGAKTILGLDAQQMAAANREPAKVAMPPSPPEGRLQSRNLSADDRRAVDFLKQTWLQADPVRRESLLASQAGSPYLRRAGIELGDQAILRAFGDAPPKQAERPISPAIDEQISLLATQNHLAPEQLEELREGVRDLDPEFQTKAAAARARILGRSGSPASGSAQDLNDLGVLFRIHRAQLGALDRFQAASGAPLTDDQQSRYDRISNMNHSIGRTFAESPIRWPFDPVTHAPMAADDILSRAADELRAGGSPQTIRARLRQLGLGR